MPKTVDMSASPWSRHATRSTPRHEASSNAIAVASSEAREPSIPTSTGSCADCSEDGTSSWITATGPWASTSGALVAEQGGGGQAERGPQRPAKTGMAGRRRRRRR